MTIRTSTGLHEFLFSIQDKVLDPRDTCTFQKNNSYLQGDGDLHMWVTHIRYKYKRENHEWIVKMTYSTKSWVSQKSLNKYTSFHMIEWGQKKNCSTSK